MCQCVPCAVSVCVCLCLNWLTGDFFTGVSSTGYILRSYVPSGTEVTVHSRETESCLGRCMVTRRLTVTRSSRSVTVNACVVNELKVCWMHVLSPAAVAGPVQFIDLNVEGVSVIVGVGAVNNK